MAKKPNAPKKKKEEVAPPPSTVVTAQEVTGEVLATTTELLQQVSILRLRVVKLAAESAYWQQRALKAEGT